MGPTRAATTDAGGKYTLSMTDLTGPYFFSNNTSTSANPQFAFMTAPATRIGVVNVTPLTTLLTAQLFGQEPASVFVNFGNNSPLANQISDATVQAAQAEVIRYLQDALGVQVKSGTADFVTATFSASAGDSMFDTIQALNAKLAATNTTLEALSARVALGSRACQTESIQITIDGVKKPFCPVVKGAVPQETDITIIDYQFKNIAEDTLTVRVQGNLVLGASFTTVGGRVFQCADTACGSITLGTPAADLSREIDFASATLAGANGSSSALADGKFVGPTPSLTLPLLPCTDNRFYVIFDNHDVVADCVIDNNNPTPIPGTFGTGTGPGRESYGFSNSGPSQAPGAPRIRIALDTSTPEPKIVSVFFQDRVPGTSQVRSRFVCQFAACNGVTIGPATPNNTAGFPAETFTLTLNDTVLTGVNEDGSPTQTTVSVRGSFFAIRMLGSVNEYPPLAPCDPSSDALNFKTPDAEFNLCIPIAQDYVWSNDLGDGRTQVNIADDMFMHTMFVIIDNSDNSVQEMYVSLGGSIGESFRCSSDCAGIVVTAPNGAGERTITFTNAVLHKEEDFPLPSDRTITLNSPPLLSVSF